MQHNNIKHYYDHNYYGKSTGYGGSRYHFQRLVRKILPKSGDKLLDVACGTGNWLRVVQRSGIKVSGIDISDVATELCKQQVPEADVVSGIAEELPWASDTFDLVTCLGSLEHFLDKSLALREMVRVSKQSGRIIILVPNADFLTRKLGFFSGTSQADISEEVLTIEAWRELIESAGLSITGLWKDLHVLSSSWIRKGEWYTWPIRTIQALALVVWPLKWQYQVYFDCRIRSK